MKSTDRLTKKLRGFAKSERGTQLVELANVLPVLLVMFAATAEFGRFFYTYTTLSKATRAGARYLTTAPVGGADDVKAQNLVVYGNTEGTGDPLVSGLTPDQVTITREGGAAVMPEHVTVQIEGYIYQPLFDLGAFIGSSSVSLNVSVHPSTKMRFLLTTPS